MSAADLLTPAEAAVVAGVNIRDVHRMIDEAILPASLFAIDGGARRLRENACAFVSFYVEMADKLTAAERNRLIARAFALTAPAGNFAGELKDGALTVDFSVFSRAVADRRTALAEARAAIEENPEILGGAPVFKGTRILVRDVAASLKKGIAEARVLKAFPSLTARHLEWARLYAAAAPERGRPAGRAAPESAAKKVIRRKPSV